MSRPILAVLASAVLGLVLTVGSAHADTVRFYEVAGVEGDDMLKMRAGPGVGFSVIVGLPNGTVLRNHGCEAIGTIFWCKVSLKQARGLKGYVSKTYLRAF